MNSDELISFPLVSLPSLWFLTVHAPLGACCDCQLSAVCPLPRLASFPFIC